MIPEALAEYWREQATRSPESAANGWSEGSQALRFLRAIEAADPEKDDSVLDWGCGTGRLYDFLPPDLEYTGLDASEAMVARATIERPEVSYSQAVTYPIAEYDHIFALGVWNVQPWNMGDTREAITHLWGRTRKTLTVSLLRRSEHEMAVCYPPLQIASWAILLSPKWMIDCAYMQHDILLSLER